MSEKKSQTDEIPIQASFVIALNYSNMIFFVMVPLLVFRVAK